VLAGALAESCELPVERLLDTQRRVQLRPAGRADEPRHVQLRALIVEQEDVGLERRKSTLADVLAKLADVVDIAHRRETHLLRVMQPICAAMRPVETEPIAHGAAEHLAYGHAKGLGLYIDERVLDRRDRLLDEATWRLARFRVKVCSDA